MFWNNIIASGSLKVNSLYSREYIASIKSSRCSSVSECRKDQVLPEKCIQSHVVCYVMQCLISSKLIISLQTGNSEDSETFKIWEINNNKLNFLIMRDPKY